MENSMIKVVAFGRVAEVMETTELFMPPVNDTDTLLQLLVQQYPGLLTEEFSIAVDKKVVHENWHLTNHAEVALLPPFSGG